MGDTNNNKIEYSAYILFICSFTTNTPKYVMFYVGNYVPLLLLDHLYACQNRNQHIKL